MSDVCQKKCRHSTGKPLEVTNRDYLCAGCHAPWNEKHLLRQGLKPPKPPALSPEWMCPRCTNSCCCQRDCVIPTSAVHRCCHLRRKQLKERKLRGGAGPQHANQHKHPRPADSHPNTTSQKRSRVYIDASRRTQDQLKQPLYRFISPAADSSQKPTTSSRGASKPPIYIHDDYRLGRKTGHVASSAGAPLAVPSAPASAAATAKPIPAPASRASHGVLPRSESGSRPAVAVAVAATATAAATAAAGVTSPAPAASSSIPSLGTETLSRRTSALLPTAVGCSEGLAPVIPPKPTHTIGRLRTPVLPVSPDMSESALYLSAQAAAASAGSSLPPASALAAKIIPAASVAQAPFSRPKCISAAGSAANPSRHASVGSLFAPGPSMSTNPNTGTNAWFNSTLQLDSFLSPLGPSGTAAASRGGASSPFSMSPFRMCMSQGDDLLDDMGEVSDFDADELQFLGTPSVPQSPNLWGRSVDEADLRFSPCAGGGASGASSTAGVKTEPLLPHNSARSAALEPSSLLLSPQMSAAASGVCVTSPPARTTLDTTTARSVADVGSTGAESGSVDDSLFRDLAPLDSRPTDTSAASQHRQANFRRLSVSDMTGNLGWLSAESAFGVKPVSSSASGLCASQPDPCFGGNFTGDADTRSNNSGDTTSHVDVVGDAVSPSPSPSPSSSSPCRSSSSGAPRPVFFHRCVCGCWGKQACDSSPLGFLEPDCRSIRVAELRKRVEAAGFHSVPAAAHATGLSAWSFRFKLCNEWMPLGEFQTLSSLSAAMPTYSFDKLHIHLCSGIAEPVRQTNA